LTPREADGYYPCISDTDTEAKRMTDKPSGFRLPQIGRLLENRAISNFFPEISRPLAAKSVTDTVARIRRLALNGGELPGEAEILARCVEDCRALASRRLRPVLNATGILLHTNLGRSPLSEAVWERARSANTGYSNLEYDLETGERGGRGGLAPELAALLAGAESALVVNNNAAAVLLALGTIAAGREVIVSRGEQVQIGGGFRIPEILALSGAKLVEVGTTNVTTTEDYIRALGPGTAAVLVVHSSNFAIRGFTEKPRLEALIEALPEGIPVIADQGSGCAGERMEGEIPASRYIGEGAALVCFSGDKLLGGPQAGIVAGRAGLVAKCARNPLMRAFRPGKTVLSLLEARLVEALSGVSAAVSPRDTGSLEAFGHAILSALPEGMAGMIPSVASTGGGTSPDEGFPSRAIELLVPHSSSALLAAFRRGDPPLVAGVRSGRVRLDLAALAGEDPSRLARLILDAVATCRSLPRGGS
jgi:L-seryl-tRNA(Ser) seleniumtransferase